MALFLSNALSKSEEKDGPQEKTREKQENPYVQNAVARIL